MSEKPLDTKLDLFKYAMSTHQKEMEEFLSADLVIPKLSAEQKKWVKNNIVNAVNTLRIIEQVRQRGKIYNWNEKTKTWEYKLVEEGTPEYEQIKEISARMYRMFVLPVYSTIKMERNKEGNKVMDALTDNKNAEEEEEELTKGLTDKITKEVAERIIPPQI